MERFTGTKVAAREKPFKMFNDNQDITVWLDPEALNKKGWELDVTPASQVTKHMTNSLFFWSPISAKLVCFAIKPFSTQGKVIVLRFRKVYILS